MIEEGRAVGVTLQGGKGTLRAKHSVISSAGVEVTYRKLLSEVDVVKAGGPPKSLLQSEELGSSHHMYGFVGFEGTTEELKLPTYNVWSIRDPDNKDAPTGDLSRAWKTLFGPSRGRLPAFLESDKAAAEATLPMFISFPSAKDPTYSSRCPGKSTAVIITESHGDYFGDSVGPPNKRGEAYEAIKQRYKTAMLNGLLRHFPHLESKVAYFDVATPLSNMHYLGRKSSYGLDQNAARFLDPTLRVAVPRVSGLYLTGQDMLCGGVFPQMLTAWLTLAKVLGLFSPDLWVLLARFGLSVSRRALFDSTYAPKHP